MKPFLPVIAIVLFFCGVVTLFLFGSYFAAYLFSPDDLQIKRPSTQVLHLGTPVHFDLYGAGFDRNTTLSLSADMNNRDAIVGSYPLQGIYNESLRSGNILYLASDRGGIQVFDIKESRRPKLLAKYLVGRTVIDIHRHSDYLYLACGKAGVSIMRILPDGLLQLITNIDNHYRANVTQFIDGFLYVTEMSSGLQLYDIRQPERVKLVKVMPFGSGVSIMKIIGNYLYLVKGAKILIYAVGVPTTPQLVGTLALSEKLNDLIILRGKLYLATDNGVSLYGLDDPTQPKIIYRWKNIGSARKFFAGANLVYVVDSSSGLRILDATAPSHSGYLDLNITPRTLVETPDYLLVAGSESGLLIVDRKVLLNQHAVKWIKTSGTVHDIFIRDHWMYTADTRGGVSLHNLESEESPFVQISSLWGESFISLGKLLFIAHARDGVEVFDISSPGQPFPVARWKSLPAMRLAAIDHYLLASNGQFGVDLVDVSDLAHPLILDHLPAIHVLAVASAGQLFYIASKDKGLLIYGVADNHKLKYLSSLQTPFPMNHFDLALSVQVQDDIAYIANGRTGLLIVDVAKPEKPIILSMVAIPGISKEVKIVGQKVFVASHQNGITVVNVEDPEKPVVLDQISISGLTKGLQIAADFIYAAQRGKGVTVIQTAVPADKIRILSEHHLQVHLPSPQFAGRYNLEVINPQGFAIVEGIITYQ